LVANDDEDKANAFGDYFAGVCTWLGHIWNMLILCGARSRGDIENIEKVQKRATKLIIFLKKLPYLERLRQIKLPTLKYRQFRGHMIEVFKLIHNFYDTAASVKLNFNPVGSTRGNKLLHTSLYVIV